MSHATVVAASREWICVRLATYENEAEAKFLETIFRGRSGKLENTTFALLGPDGRKRLSRAGRGPAQLFGTRRGPPPRGGTPDSEITGEEAEKLSELLDRLGGKYRPKAEIAALPQGLDFRRALNVASCDNQPLVVAYAKSESTRDAMEKALARLAWSERYVGRMQYVVVADRKDIAMLDPAPRADGFTFVQPDRYGLEGKVLASAKAGASAKDIAAMFDTGLSKFTTHRKETRDQRRAARRDDVPTWETEIPVTDPGIPPERRDGGRRGPPR